MTKAELLTVPLGFGWRHMPLYADAVFQTGIIAVPAGMFSLAIGAGIISYSGGLLLPPVLYVTRHEWVSDIPSPDRPGGYWGWRGETVASIDIARAVALLEMPAVDAVRACKAELCEVLFNPDGGG
jgi:hypothetical protein